jgi:VWFA-related protein
MINKVLGFILAITCSISVTAINAALANQTKPVDQKEVLRLKTDLIQLQVVVTDKQGRVIGDLKKEDFELLEQGRPQEVSFFSLERLATPLDKKASDNSPNKDKIVRPPMDPSRAAKQSRAVALFVDTFHLSGPNLLRVKQTLKQFVDEQLTDQDTVLLATTTGMFGVFGQSPQDRQALALLISRLAPFQSSRESYFTPYLAAMVRRGDNDALRVAGHVMQAEEGITPTRQMIEGKAGEVLSEASYWRNSSLAVLSAVVERVAQIPGQRLLMLLSDGFTMLDSLGSFSSGDLQSTISKAVRAGVVIYSIDVRGLELPAEFDASRPGVGGDSRTMGRLSSYMSASSKDLQDGINALASDTGGKAFFNTSDLKGAMQKSIELNRIFYSLAYYPPDNKNDKEFRRITVRVKNHPEYNVRAQKGYLASDLKKATEKELAQSPQERLFKALTKPLPLSAIDVSLTADYLETGTDDNQVSLQAMVDGKNLDYQDENGRFQIELELAAAVFDHTGKSVQTYTETIRGAIPAPRLESAKRSGFHYAKRIALKPGLYNVRVGWREKRTERIGTAAAWVEVPNLTRHKLTLSNVLLTRDSSDPAKPSAVAIGSDTFNTLGVKYYNAASPLLYYFMIYNGPSPSEGSGLTMQSEITEAGQVIQRTDWQAVASRVIGRDKKGLEIGGRLMLTLPPGLYELRISVRNDKSGQTSQRVVAFGIDG